MNLGKYNKDLGIDWDEFAKTSPVCGCGDDSLKPTGIDAAEAVLRSTKRWERWNKQLRTTPEDRAYSIGCIVTLTGNSTEVNLVSDARIYGMIRKINSVWNQSDPERLNVVSNHYRPFIASPIGIRFYVKEIIRDPSNFTLPANQWHSQNDQTMLDSQAGGVDVDRSMQYVNIVIANYTNDGTEPGLIDENGSLQNTNTSGFAWLPDQWYDFWTPADPFNTIYYQRLVMNAIYVGGDDRPNSVGTVDDVEPLWNDLYRAAGYDVRYAFKNGATAPHELGHLFNLMHTWGPTPSSSWIDPSFSECGSDPRCPDLQDNDGDYRWASDDRRPDWSGPPQDLFAPYPGRQVCEGAVPYSNVMNYGPDSEKVTFTRDQRLSVRNTLELFDTFKPMIERPAPIDCNNRGDSIRDMIVNGAPAERAYVGSQLVWEYSIDPDFSVEPPPPPPGPPFIFAPINIQPVQGKETRQYSYWACYDRSPDSGRLWILGANGAGTDPSWPITGMVFIIDPATGEYGECVVDGLLYRAYSTNNNDFAEKDDCDWIIKLKLEYREYGWTPESVVLKGGIDDPDNPCYRDDRFPDLSTFYIAEESERENG